MVISPVSESPIMLNESITKEKIIEFIDKNYIKLKSMLTDTYRMWYAIKDVKCTKKEKKTFENIKKQSKELCSNILESIESDKDVNYEAEYESFLSNCQEFYKDKKNDNEEKTETINISEIKDITSFFNNILSKVKSLASASYKKLINAIYIVINRTTNIINTLQYNYSNFMNKAKSKDFDSGIVNKRYGENDISVNVNNMNQSDITDMINKMRTISSYPSYKKMFDAICDLYGKENVGAIKLLDLDKQNKLVFISFGKLKPMVIKAGSPLYHISPSSTIKRLDPRFKSKDNITFYSSQRIYFTDKFSDPKTILKEVENPQIYRHILKEDVVAYRDSEYGSWYHNCLYIETDKSYPVENITDEVINNAVGNVEDKNNVDITEESKKPSYNEFVQKFDDKEKELSDKISSTNEINKSNINDVKKSMDELYKDYSKLTDEDKEKRTGSFSANFNKILNRAAKSIGLEKYKETKQLLKTIKWNAPMSYDTYINIKKQLFDSI